jgi:hypothetical protein
MSNGDNPDEPRDEPGEDADNTPFRDDGRRGGMNDEFSGLNRYGPDPQDEDRRPDGRREERRPPDQREGPTPAREEGQGHADDRGRRDQRSGAGGGGRQEKGRMSTPHPDDNAGGTRRQRDGQPRRERRDPDQRAEGRRRNQSQARSDTSSRPEQGPAGGGQQEGGGASGSAGGRDGPPAAGQNGDSGGAAPRRAKEAQQPDPGRRRTGDTDSDGEATDDGRATPRRRRDPAADSSGILGSLIGSDDGPEYELYQWAEADHDALTETLLDLYHSDAPLLEMRPPRESRSMDAFEEILANVHQTRIERGKNVSKQFAHEIWYDNGQIQFHFQPADKATGRTIRKQIRAAYPDASVNEVVTTQESVTDLFPLIRPGDYVAGADFRLKKPFYYPIRSGLDGESNPFETDPYRPILTDMDMGSAQADSGERVQGDDVRILVQVVLEPARKQWCKGGLYGVDVTDVAHDLQEKRLAERRPGLIGSIPVLGFLLAEFEERSPNKKQRREANLVGAVEGKSAFHLSIRVLAISPYPEFARQRARLVANDMETYYNSFTEQGLRASGLDASRIPDFVTRAATRQHHKTRRDRIARFNSNKLVQPVDAVAGLVHLPNDDINVPAVNWATQDVGPGVPSATRQGEEELSDLYEDDEDRGRSDRL